MAQQQPQHKQESMPKIDLERDKKFLSPAQLEYMRVAQAANAKRVEKLKKLRRSNLITAGALGFGVVSIFAYSMYSVGSEKFLDDLEQK